MDIPPKQTLNDVDLEGFLEATWGHKDKTTWSASKGPLANVVSQLLLIQGDNYHPIFHVQTLRADKSVGRDEDLYVIWRRGDYETDKAKQDTLKARGEAIQSWHQRKKDLTAIVTKGIANYLQTTEDSDAVEIMVNTVIATKMATICEQFGVPHADLSILFEPIPK